MKKLGIVFIAAMLTSLFWGLSTVQAQQAKKVHRIGFLLGSSERVHGKHVRRLRQALRQKGYVDGQNVQLEYRFGGGNRNSIQKHATEFVRRRLDLIVTIGVPATHAAAKATKTIPIVVAYASNLLGSGLVAGMARPGGNVTGTSVLTRELTAKHLELLTEMVPGNSRVALLYGTNRSAVTTVTETRSAAEKLRATLHEVLLKRPDDIPNAFSAFDRQGVGSLIVIPGAGISTYSRRIFTLANRYHLATICWRPAMLRDGCLMSYGADRGLMVQQAAVYVVKILEGMEPGKLPVQRSAKHRLVVNLKTARALGIKVPETILLRADEVIE